MLSKELQVVTVSYPTPVSTRYVSCSLIIQISMFTMAAPKMHFDLIYEEDAELKKSKFVCEQGSNSSFQGTDKSASFPLVMKAVSLI